MKTRKQSVLILAAFWAIILALPAFAISTTSSKALDAFRRYEPDFLNSMNKLEEICRRMENKEVTLSSPAGQEYKQDAEEIMEYVQKRYDLMDDLYKNTSEGNPADRAILMEGFQRLDDLYRRCRDTYQARFVDDKAVSSHGKAIEGKQKEAPAPQPAPQPESKQPAQTIPAVEKGPIEVAPEPAKEKKEKAKLTGKFNMDLKNRNEQYPVTYSPDRLPNNLSQFKLSLQYQFTDKNTGLLEDKYLQRRRNELVKENYLTFSFLHKHSSKTAVSFKDTLHHVWYPATSQRDYRDNLAELFWNKKEGRWERLYNVGMENRVYPNYSKSDFNQLNLRANTTLFIKNGTIFGEISHNDRTYKNSNNLDYLNTTLNLDYNQSFDGNRSEMSLTNTYDTRNYGNESINLFRTSYFDNYFSLRYNLPVSKKYTWLFEDEYQKRGYASDYSRGYAQLKLKTTAKITISKDSRLRVSHQYIFNDENTTSKSHRNNIIGAVWDRKYSDTFKIRLEDQFSRRATVVGDIMDFKENLIGARGIWKLPNKIELTWKNEMLTRYYSQMFYSDYRYYGTGLVAFYAKPKKYDWQLEQSFRKFGFRNGASVATAWKDNSQPYSEAKVNIVLRDDLKLKLTAMREKTFYKSFDTTSQELLWNFALPITVTEFTGGLEYEF